MILHKKSPGWGRTASIVGNKGQKDTLVVCVREECPPGERKWFSYPKEQFRKKKNDGTFKVLVGQIDIKKCLERAIEDYISCDNTTK